MSTNVSRLVHEAASASSVLWIELPTGTTHPAWFVWHDDGDPRGTGPAAYVVSGEGEQSLPDLPSQITLIFRSKDSGGRLLRISADVERVTPAAQEWDAAVEVLRSARLNATRDLVSAWREGVVISILSPHGRPLEGPGSYAAEPVSAPLTSARGTTRGRAPWHLGGRRRRGG